MRLGIADWLIRLQQSNGGIFSGSNRKGPMKFYSTEGNFDCYSALADHPKERQRVLHWLETEMWDSDDRRFRMGSTVDESALDDCSWAICSLGKKWATSLAYTRSRFSRTDKADSTGADVTAFADLLGKKRVWLEGSGQMAVAMEVAGDQKDADACLSEMEKAMTPSQTFPPTLGLPCVTSDPSWKGASTKIFVPSQCWYLFAKWGFNPMDNTPMDHGQN